MKTPKTKVRYRLSNLNTKKSIVVNVPLNGIKDAELALSNMLASTFGMPTNAAKEVAYEAAVWTVPGNATTIYKQIYFDPAANFLIECCTA